MGLNSQRQRLAPVLAMLDKATMAAEMQQAQRELTRAGPKRWVVVRVRTGEPEEVAIARTFAELPWVSKLSPTARERLLVIKVVRIHQRTHYELQAHSEARQLYEAGARLEEVARRTGVTAAQTRVLAKDGRWKRGQAVPA